MKVNICIFIKNEELLEKCNEIWENVSKIIKKGFDSEYLYNQKYLKTKIKSYKVKIKTNFRSDKIPKEGWHSIHISVIFIDSVYRTDKNCYPQAFLEECN